MNHITLTGNLGSGKSTICKILESQYGYEIYSTGKVQRSLATQLGISVLEMNQKMCEDSKYDKMIDDATAKISKENPEKKGQNKKKESFIKKHKGSDRGYKI